MRVALATTLHNPNVEMLPIVNKTIAEQKRLLSSISVVATTTTHKVLLKYLKVQMNLTKVRKKPGGSSGHRVLAISSALSRNPGAQYILLIDYDRFLHWLTSYPNELENFLNNLPVTYDFLSIGRSNRAFLTHPKIQIEVEQWTNKKLKEILNKGLDTTTGCYLISKILAEIIINNAKKDNLLSTTDGEWPALALVNNLKIGRINVEGLEFETPDFNKEAIKKAGSKQKWLKKVYEAEKMKKFRWMIAKETVKTAREVIIG